MAINNVFLDAQVYANAMLYLAKNQLVMGKLVDGQYKDQVTDQNGLSISIKRPPRFIAKSGATLATQDVINGSVNVAVDQYTNVHLGFGDLESVQSVNALVKNEAMKSAASTLAHKVDNFLQSKTLGFHSWVAGASTGGTNASDPSKNISSVTQAMGAHTRLMSMGAPMSGLSGSLEYIDGELLRGSMQTNFTPSLNAGALERVRIPIVSEVDFYATQNNPTLTSGTRTTGDGASTGSQVNGASQNVNYRDVKTTMTQTLNLKGDTVGLTVKAGEVFTIPGVKAWDWRNQVALDYDQQFTITADATVLAGTPTTLAVTISPAIIVQGTNDGTSTDANTAFATVDSAPADGAYVKWVGAASTAYKTRSVFNKQAIALVSARLQAPYTGTFSFATDPDTGISIRYWRGSDISTGDHYHRWDMIYGAVVTDPFLGTRLCGS